MEKDIEDIFKKIMAEEAGIRTFDDLAESFDSTYLKGLSKADATKFATWFLENGYDKEGEARAWLNENTDRLLSQSAIDDDTSFAMEQSGMDEVAETNRQFEQELLDDMEEKKPRGGPRKYPSKYTWEVTENGLEVVELRRSQFGDYRKFKSTNKGVSYFGTVDTPLFDSIEEANKNRPEVIETKLRQKKKAGGPRKYPSKYGYIVNADNKLELKELRFFEASGTRKAGYRVSEFYPSGQIKQGKMYQGQLFDSVQEAENSFKNLNMNFNEDIEDALAADRANADSLDNYPNRAEDFVPESPASTDRINQSIQESQGASDSQIDNATRRPTTKAMKFLKALDFLDPVEKVATGLLTALNLPNLARGYITYEVANLVGNLLMGGFKSTGDVQLMNSLILTGGSPEEIKAAKERIENTGAETLARIDKFSITGNIYEQIGKMLNR